MAACCLKQMYASGLPPSRPATDRTSQGHSVLKVVNSFSVSVLFCQGSQIEPRRFVEAHAQICAVVQGDGQLVGQQCWASCELDDKWKVSVCGSGKSG